METYICYGIKLNDYLALVYRYCSSLLIEMVYFKISDTKVVGVDMRPSCINVEVQRNLHYYLKPQKLRQRLYYVTISGKMWDRKLLEKHTTLSLLLWKKQELQNKAPPPPKKGTCECWLCWSGRHSQMGGEKESCCVYICKAAGKQQCVRLRLWPNLSSSLLPPTHQSSQTGPSWPHCMLWETHVRSGTHTLQQVDMQTSEQTHTGVARTRTQTCKHTQTHTCCTSM